MAALRRPEVADFVEAMILYGKELTSLQVQLVTWFVVDKREWPELRDAVEAQTKQLWREHEVNNALHGALWRLRLKKQRGPRAGVRAANERLRKIEEQATVKPKRGHNWSLSAKYKTFAADYSPPDYSALEARIVASILTKSGVPPNQLFPQLKDHVDKLTFEMLAEPKTSLPRKR